MRFDSPPTRRSSPWAPLVGALFGSTLVATLCLAASAARSSSPRAEPEVLYGRDIRPILSDRCFVCHGADPSSRAEDLRLDLREEALADRGGYAAIVPGDPDASELWYRVAHEDPELAMPPLDAKKLRLDARELGLVRRWIENGAPYEEHWAFVAPTKAPLPAVETPSWGRGPIDAFVLARLEAAGLAPSAEADRATLLRRVYLDLTGLPPTLAELDAFLDDPAPDAYERAVDRLFHEAPYTQRLAEHLTTPWLDAARYADTSGIHTDNGRQIWPWRDWVLGAFAGNMPYDQFVTEQLAGDLLPDATIEQRVATGFHRNHVTTDEGGAIDQEYLVEYAVDRAATTGSVFLGLTVGCARCHDHKFDPLAQEEFFGLFAFFHSNDEPGLYSQTADPNRAYEPFLEVPSAEQTAALAELDARREAVEESLARPLPGEASRRTAFVGELATRAGTAWSLPTFVEASSSEPGITFTPDDEGAVVVGGPVPEFEDQTFRYTTGAVGARLLLLEALLAPGDVGPGRVEHGNAVLSTLTVETRALGSRAAWRPLPLRWAWTDHTQPSGKFEATNVLDASALGWALDSHGSAPERTLMVLTDEPFGSVGGTELRVHFAFRSRYPRHSLSRVRLRVSPLVDPALLPVAGGTWFSAGPFEAASSGEAYDGPHRPTDERLLALDPTDERWRMDESLADGVVVPLTTNVVGSTFVGRTLWSPVARELAVSLGSDDGVRVYLEGEQVFENMIARGAQADQDRTTVRLAPGPNRLVIEVINTGGQAGVYYLGLEGDGVLVGELPSLLLPTDAVPSGQLEDATLAWRRRFFEDFRALDDERAALAAQRAELANEVPRTMVMRERMEPRTTYVLARGQYDHPIEERPVAPSVPAFLSPWPENAPPNRLGLAAWLTAPENPLFARVTVNRFWQEIFGTGLVSTTQDFGYQGAWPSHPELLDWLAVEFRESGWDVHALLRSFVTSSTYRQSSRVRADLAEVDPGNRLLGRYPRRRLSAEQIRDLALSVSGLLAERLGGPSVKTYQPDGLWQEVSMLASNTRNFELGTGEDLWRRSLYSYWKRAVPPPALLTLDAPVRESCVMRRTTTNTPLQALVLWNAQQFVEAARGLATRLLLEEEDDLARTERLFRLVTARRPEPEERDRLIELLDDLRAEYAARPEEAAALVAVGASMTPEGLDLTELAAWTLTANAVLNLHETLTQD